MPKFHNPVTGVQVSVSEEDGDRLLAGGVYREGDTPSNWKRPKATEGGTAKPKSTSGGADRSGQPAPASE